MAATIDMNEAPQLTKLLDLARSVDEVVITEAGTPVARLTAVPLPPEPGERIAGLHEGLGWISESFDDPLPDEFWFGTAVASIAGGTGGAASPRTEPRLNPMREVRAARR